MKVEVHCTKAQIGLDVEPSTTVKELKGMVDEQYRMPSWASGCTISGKDGQQYADDKATIKDLGIDDGADLQLRFFKHCSSVT